MEQHIVGVLDILGGMAGLTAKQPTIDPEIAGFFLAEGVVGIATLHRCQHLPTIGAAQMITLTATTYKGKRIAAVITTDLDQLRRDLTQRLIPTDAGIAAIGLAFLWILQAVIMGLVVLQPRGFLADIAMGHRMVVVTTDTDKLALVDIDRQATVARAEDTGGFFRWKSWRAPELSMRWLA